MGAIWVFELGLMQQLMQARDLLVVQLAGVRFNVHATSHFVYQSPCSAAHT